MKNPINILFVSDVQLGKVANKGDSISRSNLFGEVYLDVFETACYAIEVNIKESQPWGTRTIASNAMDGGLPCFCVNKKGKRFFHFYGNSPSNESAVPYRNGSTEIKAVNGKWPEDDHFFDNDIEVFIDIKVYKCSKCDGACTKNHDQKTSDKKCSFTRWRDLGKALKEAISSEVVIEIIDGEGVKKGMDAVTKVVSSVATRLKNEQSDITSQVTKSKNVDDLRLVSNDFFRLISQLKKKG